MIVRHAGHDDDVADPEAGRLRDRVEHQFGAGRNARHAQARLVHAPACDALAQNRDARGS